MSEFRPYSEVEAERERHPWGKPAPYKPGHKNYLAADYEAIPFSPNHIPFKIRLFNSLLAIFLLVYGTYGLIVDDIWIPGKRSTGVHYHGPAAVVLFLAICCAAAVLVSLIVDHYDQRPNEASYRRFAQRAQILGWVLFIGAMIVQFIADTAHRHG